MQIFEEQDERSIQGQALEKAARGQVDLPAEGFGVKIGDLLPVWFADLQGQH